MSLSFCDKLKELGDAEKPYLDRELKFHKLIMSKSKGVDVGEEVAEGDYFSKHMKGWGFGFASVFCPGYCKGEKCEAYRIKQSKYEENLKKYQEELSLEEKDISLEEAEKRFLYTPAGFSYAMGMAHAHLFLKKAIPKSKIKRFIFLFLRKWL